MRFYNVTAISAYIFSSFLLFRTVTTHFYTAVSELEQLIVTEENFLNSLDLYLEIEEQRLEKLKGKREEFARLHETATIDVEQFLWNPLNAYMLIKRLTTDLYGTFHLVETTYSKDVFKKSARQVFIYPEEKDLVGAADAIIRLQDFYSIDSVNLANDAIEGESLSTELTLEDSYVLGKRAYETEKWQQSIFWLRKSFGMLENKEDATVSHKIEILIHMANVHNSLHNYTAAAEVTEKILNLDPKHVQAQKNLKFYRDREESLKGKEETQHQKDDESINEDAYRSLCRGKQKKKPDKTKHLHCYITSSNNNYLLIQPSKVEVLSVKPLLLMYHDVVTDDEADILKSLAYSELEESPTPLRKPEQLPYNQVSKSAFFKDSDDSVVAAISRRLQYIVGLNSHSDAPLQVVNFGIGGFSEPHSDYEPMSLKETDLGYPFATWMVHLSDVISGGSTVFTEIDLEIKPVKGSVLFWYNFHKNGTADSLSNYADCPVLIGSKWVANKRLYSQGNEFIRKCSSNQFE